MDSIETLRSLVERAKVLRVIGDAHRTQDYAGRTHGFIYNAGELVPIAAVVIGVEGVSQEVGRARLDLLTAAVNSLPSLLDEIEKLRAEADDHAEAASRWRARAGDLEEVLSAALVALGNSVQSWPDIERKVRAALSPTNPEEKG